MVQIEAAAGRSGTSGSRSRSANNGDRTTLLIEETLPRTVCCGCGVREPRANPGLRRAEYMRRTDPVEGKKAARGEKRQASSLREGGLPPGELRTSRPRRRWRP